MYTIWKQKGVIFKIKVRWVVLYQRKLIIISVKIYITAGNWQPAKQNSCPYLFKITSNFYDTKYTIIENQILSSFFKCIYSSVNLLQVVLESKISVMKKQAEMATVWGNIFLVFSSGGLILRAVNVNSCILESQNFPYSQRLNPRWRMSLDME